MSAKPNRSNAKMRRQVTINRTKNLKPKKPTKNMSTAIMKKTRGNGVINMKSPGIASTNTALTADGKREILRRGQNIGPKVRRGHGIMRATLPQMKKSGCLNEQRTGSDKLIHIEKSFDCTFYHGGAQAIKYILSNT